MYADGRACAVALAVAVCRVPKLYVYMWYNHKVFQTLFKSLPFFDAWRKDEEGESSVEVYRGKAQVLKAIHRLAAMAVLEGEEIYDMHPLLGLAFENGTIKKLVDILLSSSFVSDLWRDRSGSVGSTVSVPSLGSQSSSSSFYFQSRSVKTRVVSEREWLEAPVCFHTAAILCWLYRNCEAGPKMDAEKAIGTAVDVLTTLLGKIGQGYHPQRGRKSREEEEAEREEEKGEGAGGRAMGAAAGSGGSEIGTSGVARLTDDDDDDDMDIDMYLSDFMKGKNFKRKSWYETIHTAVMDLNEKELATGLSALAWVADKEAFHGCFTTPSFLNCLSLFLKSTVRPVVVGAMHVCVMMFLFGTTHTHDALGSISAISLNSDGDGDNGLASLSLTQLSRKDLRVLAAMLFRLAGGGKKEEKLEKGKENEKEVNVFRGLEYIFPAVESVERALMYIFS